MSLIYTVYCIPDHCGHKIILYVTDDISIIPDLIKKAEDDHITNVNFEGHELITNVTLEMKSK